MYSTYPAGQERRTIRRLFPAPFLPLGFSLFLVLATLVSWHAAFPFLPLVPMVLFFATRRLGRAGAWRESAPAIRMPADGPPALPTNRISKEKELLEVLERHGEITAARAALETSLSVAEAEERLSGLANNGHVQVSANGGRLVYAMWEEDRR
jgi:hypothetical protein